MATGASYVQELLIDASLADGQAEHAQARPRRVGWARLLKLVFDNDMQHCPSCGSDGLTIIAAILERPVIQKVRDLLELDSQGRPRDGRSSGGQHFAA